MEEADTKKDALKFVFGEAARSLENHTDYNLPALRCLKGSMIEP